VRAPTAIRSECIGTDAGTARTETVRLRVVEEGERWREMASRRTARWTLRKTMVGTAAGTASAGGAGAATGSGSAGAGVRRGKGDGVALGSVPPGIVPPPAGGEGESEPVGIAPDAGAPELGAGGAGPDAGAPLDGCEPSLLVLSVPSGVVSVAMTGGDVGVSSGWVVPVVTVGTVGVPPCCSSSASAGAVTAPASAAAAKIAPRPR